MTDGNETVAGGGTDGTLTRRRLLSVAGTGAVALTGLGAATGTAAAWSRFDVDFRGCSEVWLIADRGDLTFDPPAVARVIVAVDGDTVCRTVEFTPDRARRIPGQYGDAPILTVRAEGDEKILGVLAYNYDADDRFGRPRCLLRNDHRCANAPGTPDPADAPCVRAAVDRWGGTPKECWFDEAAREGPGGGPPTDAGRGERPGVGRGRSR